MTLEKQKTAIIFAVPALLMITAFFGNLFVEGWNWSPFDFAIAAVLLFGTAFFINLVIRSKKPLKIIFQSLTHTNFTIESEKCTIGLVLHSEQKLYIEES